MCSWSLDMLSQPQVSCKVSVTLNNYLVLLLELASDCLRNRNSNCVLAELVGINFIPNTYRSHGSTLSNVYRPHVQRYRTYTEHTINVTERIQSTRSTWPNTYRPHDQRYRTHTDHTINVTEHISTTRSTLPNTYRPHDQRYRAHIDRTINVTEHIPTVRSTSPNTYRPHDQRYRTQTDHTINVTEHIPTVRSTSPNTYRPYDQRHRTHTDHGVSFRGRFVCLTLSHLCIHVACRCVTGLFDTVTWLVVAWLVCLTLSYLCIQLVTGQHGAPVQAVQGRGSHVHVVLGRRRQQLRGRQWRGLRLHGVSPRHVSDPPRAGEKLLRLST